MKKILILFFIAPLFFEAQNYKSDLLMVSKNFAALENYSMIVRYKLYLNKQTGKPFQESSTEIKRYNGCLRMKKTDGTEIMTNELYSISVSANQKELNVVRKDNKNTQLNQRNILLAAFELNLDSMKNLYESINISHEDSRFRTYEVKFKSKTEVAKMTLVIDMKNKMYHSVKYYYAEPIEIEELANKKCNVILEILFDQLKINAINSKAIFDEKNYIETKNGQIKPGIDYKDYTLNLIN